MNARVSIAAARLDDNKLIMKHLVKLSLKLDAQRSYRPSVAVASRSKDEETLADMERYGALR
jgi:hypothetical protein